MFLQILTLLVLVAVLLTKYMTSTHISRLKEQQAELQNLCKRDEHRYKLLCQEHEALQEQRKVMDGERKIVESLLAEAKHGLAEQEGINKDLEERSGGISR